MKIRGIIAAAALLVAGAGIAAAEEEGMYAKLTVGYTDGGVNADWNWYNGGYYSGSLTYSGIEIMPAFGFQLPVLEGKPISLAIEAQLPISIGGNKNHGWNNGYWDNDTIVVEPSAMCMVNWHFDGKFPEGLQKLVPYGGLGFGIPIQHVSYTYHRIDHYDNAGLPVWTKYEHSNTELGFKINMSLGARYDFTKQIGALAEWNSGIIGDWTWSIRGGVMFRF